MTSFNNKGIFRESLKAGFEMHGNEPVGRRGGRNLKFLLVPYTMVVKLEKCAGQIPDARTAFAEWMDVPSNPSCPPAGGIGAPQAFFRSERAAEMVDF